MFLNKYLVGLGLLATLLAPPSGHAEAVYNVTILGASFRPIDINNAGQIAGTVGVDGHTYAALYSGGVLTNLGTLSGSDSYAVAMNEAGDMTGWANYHAFLYRNGSMSDLGDGLIGFGINSQGDVVGRRTDIVDGKGFVYRNGVVTELDLEYEGYGNDINDAGAIVGGYYPGSGTAYKAFVYRDGVLTNLGTLPGDKGSIATDINNAGQVAGYSGPQDGSLRAFRYDNGVMTDLGSLVNGVTRVEDMNEHGVLLIGSGSANGGNARISVGDALVDLSTLTDPALGWTFSDITGINDLGQIVGMGCRAGLCAPVRLDLASAVPEPAAAWMLVPGLLALAGMRRRVLRRMP